MTTTHDTHAGLPRPPFGPGPRGPLPGFMRGGMFDPSGFQRRFQGPLGRGTRGGHGFPGGGFPPGGPEFRARRGDVRQLILEVLREGEANGYLIMQRAGTLTNGIWAPSPGSVYPTLALLRDEGLVAERGEGAYALTDTGRAMAEEQGETFRARMSALQHAEAADDLRGALVKLGGAIMQVQLNGDETLRARATEEVDQLRKRLYGLLSGN